MKNLLLNGNRNFVLTNYNLTFTPDQATWMAQKLRIRISMFLGGWYLDTTIGMPYLPVPGQPNIQAILGSKSPNQAQAISLLKALIFGTPGITALQQFSVSVVPNPNGPQPANIFQGSFTAQMQSGDVVTLELPGT
jgi:hypothetical protein